MILLTLSRGNEHERVHLRLPASPAEIGEAFVILDGISLDTTTTAMRSARVILPSPSTCSTRRCWMTAIPRNGKLGFGWGIECWKSATNCGAAATGSVPAWPVRLRRPNGSASPSDRLGSWKSSRRLCPLRWSKAKLQGRAWVWHNAHAGQPVRWNRRVPPRGGPQRHRAGVGQRDRSLPHRSDKKEVPLHAPCRGHHEVKRRRTPPGGHYHRGLTLSGSQRGGGQSRSCRGAFRPVYGADPCCKRNEGCR